MKHIQWILTPVLAIAATIAYAHNADQGEDLYLMEVKAKDKYERTEIANAGLSIERIQADSIQVIGTLEQYKALEAEGKVLSADHFQENGEFKTLRGSFTPMDFPANDSRFHNYAEMNAELAALAAANPTIMKISSIGKTVEGRDIPMVTISGDLAGHAQLPGIAFVGGHHAREHISIETPINLIKHLVNGYKSGTGNVKSLVDARAIYVVPMLNADGAEFDIASGRYQMWRKNRKVNSGGSVGVDLNRNYAFGWGGGGASTNPRDETYRGTSAFSEPESQAFKAFVESHDNINVLLSFHTFSELVLYPWGHTYDSIGVVNDFQVHKIMAEKMASWNGYTPQQSSDLYIASGDTTDWSYGTHKIISFTFELDPKSMWEGGFYPGQAYIDRVWQKNTQPVMYLIENAENPYQVLGGTNRSMGVHPSLLKKFFTEHNLNY